MSETPAWNDELLKSDPHAAADKRSRVQKMFAAIAPSYDLNNRLHSFWRDQAWRRKAVKLASLQPNDVVVDVACGTGDLAILFGIALHTGWGSTEPRPWPVVEIKPRVIGLDYTFPMLARAAAKDDATSDEIDAAADIDLWRGTCAWIHGDAQSLPLPDACCDVVSIAFGLRNVQEPEKALQEFKRILRPGGRVVVLEFSEPTNPLIRALNRFYTGKIMPITATLISGDKSGAYKYLPKSIGMFWSRDKMVQMLANAGFVDITQHPMTFGVCVCYRGLARAA